MNQEEYKIKNNREIINKKPDIKIFVSHRIDMEAETIDNPLYVNVRCGAVFDKRENIDMLGDDTGDNISEKRESFNELTVQYWAWKNVEADYYGLCHYRRYLSFSGAKPKEVNHVGLYKENYLSLNTIEKYGLSDINLMNNTIEEYDCIFMEPIHTKNIPTPHGFAKSVGMLWKYHQEYLIKQKFVKLALEYIKKNYNEIYIASLAYLKSNKFIGYNVFIMKKDIFYEYSKFLFDVLYYVEPHISKDNKYYSEQMNRTLGFLSEILLGIYSYYLKEKKIKIKYLPLIFFENVKKQYELKPMSSTSIPIVFILNEYTLEIFSVFLQSLIENVNKQYDYDIIILETKINKNSKYMIYNMVKKYPNISIRYVDPEYVLGEIKRDLLKIKYSRNYFYKFIIPWILKKYYKVIYIEPHNIVNKDIIEFYQENIIDYYAGGFPDIISSTLLNIEGKKYSNYLRDTIKLEEPYNYITPDIILLNLKKIRENYKLSEIFDNIKDSKYCNFETDYFNLLYGKNMKVLNLDYIDMQVLEDSYIYNFITHCPHKLKKLYDKKNAIFINYQLYTQNPKFIPSAQTNIWWQYARKTPFYEMILYRMIHEQSSHISSATIDHFSRIMFPFKWLKKVHKVGYIRHITDKLLPHGTKRRKIVKKLLFG